MEKATSIVLFRHRISRDAVESVNSIVFDRTAGKALSRRTSEIAIADRRCMRDVPGKEKSSRTVGWVQPTLMVPRLEFYLIVPIPLPVGGWTYR